MKNILVTGASGFLGGRICKYFSDKYKVIAPTHKEMELTELESVMSVFNEEVPEIVIHCGAISDVRKCDENSDVSYSINVVGTENIAKACAQYQSKLIFCSSDQIYFGCDSLTAHYEHEKTNPINNYGKQKLEAERICLDYCEDAVVLRLSWMYDYQQLNASEHRDFFRNLMKALSQNKTISYPIYDYRGITHVQTVLKNIEKVFLIPGGIYNFGSENELNTYETVKKIINELGLDEKIIAINEQAFSEKPRNIRMCIDKIKAYGILFPSTSDSLVECAVISNSSYKTSQL